MLATSDEAWATRGARDDDGSRDDVGWRNVLIEPLRSDEPNAVKAMVTNLATDSRPFREWRDNMGTRTRSEVCVRVPGRGACPHLVSGIVRSPSSNAWNPSRSMITGSPGDVTSACGFAHGVQDCGRIRVRGSYVDEDVGRCCSTVSMEQSSVVLVLVDSVLRGCVIRPCAALACLSGCVTML